MALTENLSSRIRHIGCNSRNLRLCQLSSRLALYKKKYTAPGDQRSWFWSNLWAARLVFQIDVRATEESVAEATSPSVLQAGRVVQVGVQDNGRTSGWQGVVSQAVRRPRSGISAASSRRAGRPRRCARRWVSGGKGLWQCDGGSPRSGRASVQVEYLR